MGFFIILPFAALAGWSIFAIFRWLKRGGYERKWWQAFAMLSAVGFVLGSWCASSLRYNVANVHLEGFPIPIGIASREKPGARWVKSDMPFAIRCGGALTDVLGGIAVCLAPIAVAAFFKEHRATNPRFNPPASDSP